ncbi:MAG TPA: hypothetical protein VED00_00045 [archaeon]|nr:hypothetical protein [archaeon]
MTTIESTILAIYIKEVTETSGGKVEKINENYAKSPFNCKGCLLGLHENCMYTLREKLLI